MVLITKNIKLNGSIGIISELGIKTKRRSNYKLCSKTS